MVKFNSRAVAALILVFSSYHGVDAFSGIKSESRAFSLQMVSFSFFSILIVASFFVPGGSYNFGLKDSFLIIFLEFLSSNG
jgi:hypothetical protein